MNQAATLDAGQLAASVEATRLELNAAFQRQRAAYLANPYPDFAQR